VSQPSAVPIVANFVAFQLGWFACVLGAAHGLPWAGTGVALAIVAWHLSRAARPRAELVLVLIAAGVGAVWDSGLSALGWIRYPSGVLIEGTAPHWIVAMWMLFATTLNVSLAWLRRNRPLAAVFGALGGPLAYVGGAKLGALTFAAQDAALVALALGWAVLTPLLLQLARRFDGFTSGQPLRPQVAHA
jgi:hypothetical protein